MSHPTQTQLNLANIRLIDRGNIELACNHALRMVAQDIIERPGDKGARKVLIEVEAKPVLDKNTAALDTINYKFKIDARLPKRVSDDYPMLPMSDGTVTFQPNSPGDPRQYGMFAEGTDGAKAAEAPEPPDNMDPATGEVPDDDDDLTTKI